MYTISRFACVIALFAACFAGAQERGNSKAETVGTVKSVDAAAGTITILISEGRRDGGGVRGGEEVRKEKTFTLAKNAEVVAAVTNSSGVGRGSASAFKAAKLADLAAGIRVILTMSADQKTVESVVAEGPQVKGTVKAIDLTKNTITIQTSARAAGRDGTVTEAEEKTFSISPDTEVSIDDGRGARFSIKEGKLADVPQKALVTARLFVDGKHVQSIAAEGPMHHGTIKAVDAKAKTLTLTTRTGGRGDDAGDELSLSVASDAVILVDDGSGRRLSVKYAKLAEIPTGAVATVKLSADSVSVMHLRAEGPTLTGQFKAADATKGTITISIAKGRDEAEEKNLTLAKDVRIRIDGKEANVGDLKVTEHAIQLRLSLDQKTVQAVISQQPGSR